MKDPDRLVKHEREDRECELLNEIARLERENEELRRDYRMVADEIVGEGTEPRSPGTLMHVIDLDRDTLRDMNDRAEQAEKRVAELEDTIKRNPDGSIDYARMVSSLNGKIRALEATVERRDDTLHQLRQWCEAYPLDIFPEPDMKQARKGLEYVGITLDAQSNMRHVLKGVGGILDQALAGDGEKRVAELEESSHPLRKLGVAGMVARIRALEAVVEAAKTVVAPPASDSHTAMPVELGAYSRLCGAVDALAAVQRGEKHAASCSSFVVSTTTGKSDPCDCKTTTGTAKECEPEDY